MIPGKTSAKVTDASRRPMDIRGIIPHYIDLSHLKVWRCFLACPSLGAHGMGGARSIDRYVNAIYLGQKKGTFHRAPPLASVGSGPRAEATPQRSRFPKQTVSSKVQ